MTFLAERVSGLAAAPTLDDYDPDRVSRIAGVPADQLRLPRRSTALPSDLPLSMDWE